MWDIIIWIGLGIFSLINALCRMYSTSKFETALFYIYDGLAVFCFTIGFVLIFFK